MRPRRPSLPTVLASLALFVALGGTAIAARHYLITSTNQIKPSVLKKLHGKRGARGAAGATGPAGVAGAKGTEGKEGKEGRQGPQGIPGARGPQGVAAASQGAAYAHILADGTVDAEHSSSNFVGVEVTHTLGSGAYCVKGLASEPHNVIAHTVTTTVDAKNGPGLAEASVNKPFALCPEEADVEILTFNPSVGAPEDFKFEDFAFYLLIN